MATSTGKTIGLILIVLLILAASWRLTPLILAPFGALTGAFHMFRMPEMDTIHIGPWFFPSFATTPVIALALFVLWIAVIIWVYKDAERRGMNGILWALLVLIGNLIGLLIYLIVRTEPVTAPVKSAVDQSCPQCREPVAQGFSFCPHCGAALRTTCPQCGKAIEKDWKACPHCGRSIAQE